MSAPALFSELLHVGREIDAHKRLVTHDPGIVSGRYAGEITRPQVHLVSVSRNTSWVA